MQLRRSVLGANHVAYCGHTRRCGERAILVCAAVDDAQPVAKDRRRSCELSSIASSARALDMVVPRARESLGKDDDGDVAPAARRGGASAVRSPCIEHGHRTLKRVTTASMALATFGCVGRGDRFPFRCWVPSEALGRHGHMSGDVMHGVAGWGGTC